jgi:ribosomal subunit interface protein
VEPNLLVTKKGWMHMRYDFNYKGLDHSEALEEYAQGKLDRVEKYMKKDGSLHIFFSRSGLENRVDVVVNGIHGSLEAHAIAESHQKAIDFVEEKLVKQLNTIREKQQNHRNYKKPAIAM